MWVVLGLLSVSAFAALFFWSLLRVGSQAEQRRLRALSRWEEEG